MKCLTCGNNDLPVQDSRPLDDGVKRRRICTGCGQRWITIEKIDEVYVPAPPGPSAGTQAKNKPKPAVKAETARQKLTEARRKVEAMRDEKDIDDE